MTSGKALVADSDTAHSERLCIHIRQHGWMVDQARSLTETNKQLSSNEYKLVVCALDVGGGACESLFSDNSAQLSEVDEIILMSETDDPTRVSSLMREGASYFFCKPFDEMFFGQLIDDLNNEL